MPPQPTEQILRSLQQDPRLISAYLDALVERLAARVVEQLSPTLARLEAKVDELRRQDGAPERWLDSTAMAAALPQPMSRRELLAWAGRHDDLRDLAHPPRVAGQRAPELSWPERCVRDWFEAHAHGRRRRRREVR